MGYLVTSNLITTEVQIEEDDLRRRLVHEVMEQIGVLGADGKPRPGLTSQVLRGDGGREKGGYVIRITRDLTKDPAAQLPKPEGK